MPHTYALSLLARRLRSIAELSDAEEEAVMALPVVSRAVAAGIDFVLEGDEPNHCALVVDGWAGRHKTTADGRRQMLSLHFAGEIPDLQSLLLRRMDHSLAALTDCLIGYISHASINAALDRHQHLTRPLWRSTLVDGSIYREWLLAAARLDAAQHMGHLFCEIYLRREAVGLASDQQYEFPITQAVLGEALGLSSVHVNRTAMALRSRGLIEWANGVLAIPNFNALAHYSQFTPDYLHHVA